MFHFKKFSIQQRDVAMKVGTDGILLGSWVDVDSIAYCLDIGTGTGLLSLMIAQRNAQVTIDAIDIDEKAVIQAKENVSNSQWFDRIQIMQSDIADFESAKKYDLIISNPPYFSNGFHVQDFGRNKARVAENLNQQTLLIAAQKFLSENGSLAVILPTVEGEIFIDHAMRNNFYCRRKTLVHLISGKAPKRMLIQCNRTIGEMDISYLDIESEIGKYSKAFKKLTAEFYLKF